MPSAVREAIGRYEPSDRNEIGFRSRFIELLDRSGPHASLRTSFSPGHLTASAFIVDENLEFILLHHHRRLGRWLQMGGHLDPGETPLEAASREAREESGLDEFAIVPSIFDLDIHAIPEGRGEPEHLHYDIRFLVSACRAAKTKRSDEESSDLGWFDLDEAERRMNEEASSRVLRKIRDARLESLPWIR